MEKITIVGARALHTIPEAKEQVLPAAENLSKALLLIALLCASFYGADRIAAALDAASALSPAAAMALKWGCVALLAVADGVILIGMSVLAHDAVHRVLFRSTFWNEFWGGLLSALALIPFHANRQFGNRSQNALDEGLCVACICPCFDSLVQDRLQRRA
jgi:hypothetical protein